MHADIRLKRVDISKNLITMVIVFFIIVIIKKLKMDEKIIIYNVT